jgi:hypothetical protein
MFCSNCGIEISSDVNFCQKCGNKINISVDVSNEKKQETIELPPKQNAGNEIKIRHRFVTFWLILCIVVDSITVIFGIINLISGGRLLNEGNPITGVSLLHISISCFLSIPLIIGYAALLTWHKEGFNWIISGNVFSIIHSIRYLRGIPEWEWDIWEIIFPILSVIILHFIFYIKKNGVSVWEHLNKK